MTSRQGEQRPDALDRCGNTRTPRSSCDAPPRPGMISQPMDGTDALHKKSAPQSPYEVQLIHYPNGYAEASIGIIKKQCLNHFICFSLDHLDHINHEWLAYYNNERPHQGVDIGNKVLRPDFKPADKGEIKREQRLGGVISWYYRDAA